jgi:copper chaperone
MDTLKFKTDIKCSGCVAKVTPHLNQVVGEGNWKVNTEDPSKILSVSGATEADVKEAVSRAGYKAEKI